MDHNVDGRVLMPATSYVVTAWEAAAEAAQTPMAEYPVVFEDVAIHQAVVATRGQEVMLAVQLAPASKFYVRTSPYALPHKRLRQTNVIHCSVHSTAAVTCVHSQPPCQGCGAHSNLKLPAPGTQCSVQHTTARRQF